MAAHLPVSVIVVGAGASGLAAATALHSAGFDVTVLEAQNRSGGRIHCELFPDKIKEGHPEFIEYGAQWIHGEKHAVYELARTNGFVLEKKAGCLQDEDEATGEFVTNEGQMVLGAEKELIENCLMFLNEALVGIERREGLTESMLDSENVAAILRKHFEEFLQRNESYSPRNLALCRAVYDWLVRYQEIDNGCLSLDTLSLRAFCDYGLDGDNTTRLNIPLRHFLDHISKSFPKDRLQLCHPVKTIHVNDAPSNYRGTVTVLCDNGKEFHADHVVVTCSLGVLKRNMESLFRPALPERKRQAIQAAGYGVIGKILLQFSMPFWETLEPVGSDGFQLLWTGNTINNDPGWCRHALGFDVVRTAANMLVLWIAPPGAMAVEVLSDEQVKRDCHEILKQFTRYPDVPFPERILRENWGSNPYTLGTYSFISTESAQAGFTTEDLAEPVFFRKQTSSDTKEVPSVLFAGEATCPLFWSTVHGAVLSGWREAERLKNFYEVT